VANDYLRRTAIVRPDLTDNKRHRLDETVEEWKTACNISSRIGWAAEETRKTRLQQLAYDRVREETRLGSQHAILATRQAAEALSGVDSLEGLETDYATSRPTFTSDTVTYDARTMTLFDDGSVSLATVEDRIRVDLGLPADGESPQRQYIDCDEWELTESTVSKRDGRYELHLGFRKPRPKPKSDRLSDDEDRTVLGVDLGITNIATTSTAYFASGRELRHEHREFERIRACLQRTGTQSAHRTIQQMSGREARYLRDQLHQIANDIVAEALDHDCQYVAVENLKHIRERAPPAKEFHQWAHRQLVDMITYKARTEGIRVVFVSPENTSQRCPDCEHTSANNRRTRSEFACERCGATGNADYVAAKNVGWRYVRRGLQSSRRTGDGRLALKSGTVAPEQGFVRYAASA